MGSSTALATQRRIPTRFTVARNSNSRNSKQKMTLILGIETSCDETAAAVIEDGTRIRSNVVASQIDIHSQYGGVFPEVASRIHVEAISVVARRTLDEASV